MTGQEYFPPSSLTQINRRERLRNAATKRRRIKGVLKPFIRGELKREPSSAVFTMGDGPNFVGAHLGLHDPIVAGEIFRRKITTRQEIRSAESASSVVHVKNGKPLTAHGAKLLAVPWDGDK